MILRVCLFMLLPGCSIFSQVHWPEGPLGPGLGFLPVSELAAMDSNLDSQGAALAARAAALRAEAAAIVD